MFDEYEDFSNTEGWVVGGDLCWYGIPGLKLVWNCQDLEIEYHGMRCSCYDVENALWQMFTEEGYTESGQFEEYLLLHHDDAREICEVLMSKKEEH